MLDPTEESRGSFRLNADQSLGSNVTHGALWIPRHVQQFPAPCASQFHSPKRQVQGVGGRKHYRAKVIDQGSRVIPNLRLRSTSLRLTKSLGLQHPGARTAAPPP